MRLSEFLRPEQVLLQLRSDGTESAVRTMVDHLAAAGVVQDVEPVVSAVLDREASHSTILRTGVALPHAAVPGIAQPVLLVAVAPAGTRFGAASESVRLFFLLLSPLEQAGTHIKLLARIVRLVRDPELVSAILESRSVDAVVEAIARVDALHV